MFTVLIVLGVLFLVVVLFWLGLFGLAIEIVCALFGGGGGSGGSGSSSGRDSFGGGSFGGGGSSDDV